MKKAKIITIISAALLLIAAFLRLYRLPEFITFLGDQGRDAIIIKRIVTFEHFPAIGPPTSIGQVYLGPFFYYLMSPFLLISNFEPVGLGFATALLTIVGICFAYYSIKKDINHVTALGFLGFVTFSFVNIELSRFAWNPNLLPVFSFFTLYFFYKTTQSKKIVYPLLFGAFLSFSIQLHYLAVLLIPSIFISGLIYITKKETFKIVLVKIALSASSLFFFSIPLLIFDLRHQFLNTNNFIRMFSQENQVNQAPLLDRLIEATQSFVTHNLLYAANSSTALIFLCLFTTIGLLLLVTKKMPYSIQIFYYNSLLYLLGFAFFSSPRHPHYYTPVYWSVFIVIAYMISVLRNKLLLYTLLCSVVLLYAYTNSRSYYFLKDQGSLQIPRAKKIAASVEKQIKASPYQMVALPEGETDGQVRYFLEIYGKTPLPENSLEQPKELFVICYVAVCNVDGHPQWQIASFQQPVTDTIWSIEGVTIYKLVHGKTKP